MLLAAISLQKSIVILQNAWVSPNLIPLKEKNIGISVLLNSSHNRKVESPDSNLKVNILSLFSVLHS